MSSNRIIDIQRTESNPSEPVTLTEAKARLIIDFTGDDTLITSLITSCRKAVENACHISIVAKTITFIADLCKEWELPYGPVTGISFVGTRTGSEGSGPGTYVTQESGWTTDGSDFLSFAPFPVAGGFNPGVPFTGHFQWGPEASKYNTAMYRYKIIYTVGYTTVPEDLKQAILAQIVHDYENRGDVESKIDIANISRGLCVEAENLAAPYRRQLWF